MSNYRTADGKYHLKLVYPNMKGGDEKKNYNEWKQTSNPVTESDIKGYEAVKINADKNGVGEGRSYSLINGFIVLIKQELLWCANKFSPYP